MSGYRACRLVLLVLFLVTGRSSLAQAQPSGCDSWDAVGPFYQKLGLTLAEGSRVEAVGPFYSSTHYFGPASEAADERRPGDSSDMAPTATPVQEVASTLVFSPLFALHEDGLADAVSWDFLYPILTYDRYGPEYRLQLVQLISVSGGETSAGDGSKTTSVFPFFLHRHSSNPLENYTAIWPFYGRTQSRFFRDEVRFLMWPLYAQTRKKDILTDNYLVPFFHLRHGVGLQGWQFWPLVGTERKIITQRTNGFGDVELVGGKDTLFLLWPFYFRNDFEIGTTNPVRQRVLLPFYSFQLSPAKDTRTYLWPLGPTFVDDRAEAYRQIGAPWPFVVFGHGPNKEVQRVFPLFGHAQSTNLESSSYLWPLYRHKRFHQDPLDREQTRILFFLYTDLTEKNTHTGKTARRSDLWPLFITRRDAEGRERFQLIAPLEPILASNPGVARLYSPLWSIWRSERDPRAGRSSQSLLWNLYRSEQAGDRKKCSLLFGLIQYHSGPEGARWRWLYVLGGKTKKKDRSDVPEHR